MDLGLTSRRALVLASSAGFGKAIAATLAEEGARVVISGRDAERLAAAAADVNAAGYVAGDLREQGEAARIVNEAVEQLGGLDILVVNTGGGGAGPLGRSTPEKRDFGYQALLRPALDAALEAAPKLAESGSGRLLFLTARSVLEATTDLAMSSVFRSGVYAAARSLAVELAPNVLVNVVVPGQFDTAAYHQYRAWVAKDRGVDVEEISRRHLAEVSLGRLGTAEELANVVAFYASERASFVTGSVIRVDGGAVKAFL